MDWVAEIFNGDEIEVQAYVDNSNERLLGHIAWKTGINGGELEKYLSENYELTFDHNSTAIVYQSKTGEGNYARKLTDRGFLWGTNGHDEYLGSFGNDVIGGGLGNDRVLGDSGNDRMYGDQGGDTIHGNQGDDLIFLNTDALNIVERDGKDPYQNLAFGDEGNDTLNGQNTTGNNHYFGWTGNDYMIGGEGHETFWGDTGSDIIDGRNGNDIIFAHTDNQDVVNLLGKDNEVNWLYGGEGNDTLDARNTTGENHLFGGNGNDILFGENGNDYLHGGKGDDSLSGGLGNDTYIVDSAEDIITENENEGIDTVQSSIPYYLYVGQNIHIENITLTGSESIVAAGNNLDNRMIGNNARNVMGGAAGNDTLEGRGGNDLLGGNEGDDSLIGGTGDDDYRIENIGDVVVEEANEGIDIVYVSEIEEYTLGNNVENLILTDGNTLNGFGNNLKNQIGGNSNNNLLQGFDCDDVLGGQAGNDTLEGGDGRDRLRGGDDIDVLTGGGDRDIITGDGGADIFRFESLDGSVDTITDFSAATGDKIEISASFGGGITVGVLDDSQFTIGSSASTTNHRIIYDDRTGGLFFDADGVGGENQVQFAILAELTNDEIFVI